ncbi:site-specific integrase [uncultured Maribacter sp.]|uniref:tyrosine-type recombinase/integrase n=1 Tax=uncultured Maribacter sp. TaxID=431308 RepID=UPI00261CD3C8|nr:site-specific integrase [uncultured Maribacter sp.]
MTLLVYLEQRFSATSIASYHVRITKYMRYNKKHKKGTLQDILTYIQLLRNQNKHPKTIKNHLHSIKVYYDFLQYTGKRKDHPCKKLQLKDKMDKRIKVTELYSSIALQEYLNATAIHKKLLVSFLVYQALTTSELVALKIKHFNTLKAQVTLPNRTLALHAIQMPILMPLIAQKKQQEYLFTSKNGTPYVSSQINEYINKSRPEEKKITPLKIRQSVIKNLLYKNDIRIVQVFAGHKVSATTAQYRTTNLEELKQLINTKHPLQ